jgi:hypothetical protein
MGVLGHKCLPRAREIRRAIVKRDTTQDKSREIRRAIDKRVYDARDAPDARNARDARDARNARDALSEVGRYPRTGISTSGLSKIGRVELKVSRTGSMMTAKSAQTCFAS